MGFRVGRNITLYNIKKCGNYYEAKGYASKRDMRYPDEKKFVQCFNSYVRIVNCDDIVSKLGDGAVIELKEIDVETNYNKERKREYAKYLIYDFRVVKTAKDSFVINNKVDYKKMLDYSMQRLKPSELQQLFLNLEKRFGKKK